jgi:hypothetical protein
MVALKVILGEAGNSLINAARIAGQYHISGKANWFRIGEVLSDAGPRSFSVAGRPFKRVGRPAHNIRWFFVQPQRHLSLWRYRLQQDDTFCGEGESSLGVANAATPFVWGADLPCRLSG